MDHDFYVPSGMRNSETRKFSEFKYHSLRELRDAGHPHTDHQVFLAHGACDVDGDGVLDTVSGTDEQFYFEDPEDARWYYREGYKRMLYKGEAAPDRMALWIDGKEAGKVGYDAPIRGGNQ
jgi:hypothetical protein